MSILRRAGVTATVLATAFAAWGGFSYWQATTSDTVAAAAARDDVLTAGRTAVATMTSLDYRDVDAGLARWLDTSTGALHEELKASLEGSKQQIQQAKATTTGTVLDLALTELDEPRGTARLIAAVEMVVKPEIGEPATKRSRFQAELIRTPAGWKVGGLAQVPYIPV